MKENNKAFTLSEVLIAMVVIGIIAAMTIPAIIASTNNMEHKIAYKKAYSDLSNATLAGIAFSEFPLREEKYSADTTTEEWEGIKSGFKVQKLCENNNAYDCWVDADRLCIGCAFADNTGAPKNTAKAFVDISGRVWTQFTRSENIYLVDTNGDKGPNHFGKDRWAFTFADKNGDRICSADSCTNSSLPYKVKNYPESDYKSYNKSWCQHPPCYYKSWLYK